MKPAEAFTALRKQGYFVVAWSPEDMEGMDEEARYELEERLIEHGNEYIDELRTDEDEDDTCPTCNGCGEGQYDGTRCSTCKGKGVIREAVEWSE